MLGALVVPPVVALVVFLVGSPARTEARREEATLSEAVLQAERFLGAMVNQETGLRGFLLGRQEAFLEPLLAGRPAASEARLALARLVGDDVRLVPLLAAVDGSRTAWEEAADQAREQPDGAADGSATDRRNLLFDAVRADHQALAGELEGALVAARGRSERLRNLVQTLLAVTVSASVVAALAGSALLVRWLAGPLARLSADLRAAVTRPDEAVAVAGPRELATLAADIDGFRQAMLDESAERVRRNLLVAQEEERRRIAEGLHDDTIQTLTAAALRLQVIGPAVPAEDQELLAETQQAVSGSIERLRQLVFELHPPALDRHGLAAALEAYGAELCDRSGIRFQATGTAEKVSRTIEALAYRAGREAVMNACKHAAPTTVDVDVSGDGGGVRVRVSDDGRGFVLSERAPVPGHLGLDNVRALVEGAGGTLEIRSAPHQGTTVDVWIPDSGSEAVVAAP